MAPSQSPSSSQSLADAARPAAVPLPVEQLSRALGETWRCIPDAVIRAYGEEGRVDLALLHPEHGIALVGFLDEGEEASPDEATEAFRAMLREDGFAGHCPGDVPVRAFAVPPSAVTALPDTLREACAAAPASTAPPEWVDWLAGRLAPAARHEEPAWPSVVLPRRDEPVPDAPGADGALVVTPEMRLTRRPAQRGTWARWGTSLIAACAVLVAVLLVLGLTSHGGLRLPAWL
jgi:hypothetical protein